MDYFFLSTLRNRPILPGTVSVSYDIACQWERNAFKRAKVYPSNPMGGKDAQDIHWKFNVPKFHLAAHVGPCQLTHSFNLTPEVGRVEGESPERLWAPLDKLAPSTMQMGPGTRWDVVDDDFGDWNWTKITRLGQFSKNYDIMLNSLVLKRTKWWRVLVRQFR